MNVPKSSRKKALILVDIQPSFIDDRNKYILENILKLLKHVSYDLYIEANFHAEKGSLWDIQQQWTCPEGPKTETVKKLSKVLIKYYPVVVEKETKSVFKGNKNIHKILKQEDIEEVHLVGLDTDDCVLATAYESFDLGFITYVLEECCQSSASDELHHMAIQLLREQHMTNHSIVEKNSTYASVPI